MDVNSSAEFINEVADGQKIPCPSCNTINEPNTRFCITCGTKLIQPVKAEEAVKEEAQEKVCFCPECGEKLNEGAMFCASCGTKLIQYQEPEAANKEAASAFEEAKQPETQSAFEETKQSEGPVAFEETKQPEASKKVAFQMFAPPENVEDDEPSPFAEGLPDWDIVPPSIMVRRKRR